MNRPWLLLLLLLLSLSGALAQSHRYAPKQGKSIFLSGRGTVVSAPDLVVPDTVYLGLVRARLCDSIVIPLKNNNADSITIETIYLDPDISAFEIVEPLSRKIDSGGEARLVLRFCPMSPGSSTTALFIAAHIGDTGTSHSYRIGVRGDADAPRIVVDRGVIDFGDVGERSIRLDTFTISNRGAFPLRVEGLKTSTPYFNLLLDRAPPFSIAPDSSKEIIVEFTAANGGDMSDSVTIESDSYYSIPPVQLRAHVLMQRIGLDADTIRFDAVRLGYCHDTTLVIHNLSDKPLGIRSAQLLGLSGASGFELRSPIVPSDGHTILQNGNDTISIHFCPRAIGTTSDGIHIEDDTGLFKEVVVIGEGTAPLVWLDTTSANAGEHLTLALHLPSAAPDLLPVGKYTVTLRVMPQALFPSRVFSSDDNNIQKIYQADGTITISGDNGGKGASDGVLFRIEFRGLSTGEPENIVSIDTTAIPGIDSVIKAGNGVVYLSGCDVGKNVRFSRKIRIRSVDPGSESSEAIIFYTATEGSAPWLRVYSLTGNESVAIPLPDGTGSEQVASVPTDSLCKGIYIFELQDRSERVAVPVMIAK